MIRRGWISIVLIAMLSSTAVAQDFVYVNNNAIGANTVSAFSVGINGALTPLPGSPYPTGGSGNDAGPYGTTAITACAVRNFLYVANSSSNNISVFSINPAAGGLTLVPGSPFSSGGVGGINGISLAATPDNQFLFAANSGSADIAAFHVEANGALVQVGSPVLADQTIGVKVSPDGRFLMASGGVGIFVFAISSSGTLAPVPGSPFNDRYTSVGIDFDCQSRFAFVGKAASFDAIVGVFSVGGDGSLTAIPGSPFSFPPGKNANTVVLTPDDLHLYVGNQQSSSITGLNVAPDGSLTAIPGSPFYDPNSWPVTMATDRRGRFLFVAELFGGVAAFAIGADGALSAVPGSPFPTGPGYGTRAVVAFPPKACGPLNQPPVCANAAALTPVIWPPNHRLSPVTITGVTDPDGDPVTTRVTRITQDEPVNGRGDGNTCPDAQIVDGQAAVRAERTGSPGLPGNGRVYAISFTADDGKGGTCDGTVFVRVPHDQGDPTCADDGQRYNSLGACGHEGGGLAAEGITSYGLKVSEVTANRADLEFSLPAESQVQVSVFDVTGRRLATVENSWLSAGTHQRTWDMSRVSKGVYFVRMQSDAATLTKTVLKVR